MGINPSNLGVFKSIFPCFETVLAAFYHVLLRVPQLMQGIFGVHRIFVFGVHEIQSYK